MKVTVSCQTCGKQFDVHPSRLTYGRGRSCSRTCQYAATSKQRRRPVTLTCVGCGRAFERAPSKSASASGKGKYCSRLCRDLSRIGPLHPQYLGGPTDKRGPNWQAQRRKALRRDGYTCQQCGRPALTVHHVKPYRLFGANYRQANHLSNLMTLCWACHRRADATLQASERLPA